MRETKASQRRLQEGKRHPWCHRHWHRPSQERFSPEPSASPISHQANLARDEPKSPPPPSPATPALPGSGLGGQRGEEAGEVGAATGRLGFRPSVAWRRRREERGLFLPNADAFFAEEPDGGRDIWIMDMDGTHQGRRGHE
jgi:hypothetical protein